MIRTLSRNIIFLHGLSGSGKGELQRQLMDFHEQRGYHSVYMSAGDIVRRSLTDTHIRQTSLSGSFFDSLEPIQGGLRELTGEFAETLASTEGRTILIIDGVVRKSNFEKSDGTVIPSQLQQLATIMDDAFSGKVHELPELYTYIPEYRYSPHNAGRVELALKNSNHIVLDVLPEDAEKQMSTRAERELSRIAERLDDLGDGDIITADIIAEVGSLTQALALIAGENVDPQISEFLMEVKKSLGRLAGIEDLSSLANLFSGLGIETNIREDDVSPNGRASRIGNFYQKGSIDGDKGFTLGPIAQVLVQDLNFGFNNDTGFVSLAPNCRVIINGESRGVSLSDLQEQGRQLAQDVFLNLEREMTLGEGMRNRNTEQI